VSETRKRSFGAVDAELKARWGGRARPAETR
jgi:hypothetical protein